VRGCKTKKQNFRTDFISRPQICFFQDKTDASPMHGSNKDLENPSGDSTWAGIAHDSSCKPLEKNKSVK